MFGSKPRLKIARPSDGIRSTENRLHPVASSSSISPAFSTVAPGICSSPSRNRADASISGLTSRGDLYSGSEQPEFDALDGQDRPPDHETCEFPGVLGDRGVAPLLAQLGHLRGFAGDHPGPRRVLLQDAALQELRWAVGVAAGDQRHHLGARGQSAGNPEHPHRHDGAVLVGFESLDELRRARPAADRRRRAARALRRSRRDARAAAGRSQSLSSSLLGRRGDRRQHQRVVGGG